MRDEEQANSMRLTLISMPWAIFNRPSIQLGTLKGFLGQQPEQIKVDCLHPYLAVAARLGMDYYRQISENPWAGEALYCGLLFPGQAEQAAQVFARYLPARITGMGYGQLLSQLEEEMEKWLDQLQLDNCSLIGFSVCFSQLPASLYAARKIKARWPDIPIVMGGSTCTRELGSSLLAEFSAIDYVITGEGEQPLQELLLHLNGQTELTCGTILRKNQTIAALTDHEISEIADLSSLPLPVYDDYFQEMQILGLDFIPVLPIEFSRGCWWNKCTFCNLNLQWQGYRAKKAEQVATEVKEMHKKYQCLDYTFTDNALPVKEADLFFATMADSGKDLRFFGEIRTLKKAATYHLYRKGGLNSVQVGIEALSDSLLARMNKGTTVMDNLVAMKFAASASMTLDGNLILEFPGSSQEEVTETLRILELALPFRPLSAAGFFLGHGSPVCVQPKQYGITAIVQHPNNRKLYPKRILDNLDMLIKSWRGDRTLQKKQWLPVRNRIVQWHQFHARRPDPSKHALSYRDGGDFIIIRQERINDPPLHHRLRGLSRRIYLACEEPVEKKKLLTQFSQVTKEQLSGFLADLEQKKILYANTKSCLALAVRQP